MGQDIEYQPCPISPRTPWGKMRKLDFCFLGAIVVLLALFLTYLVLYLKLQSSEPAKQLSECQSRMQNQTSQTQAEITSLRQRVEAANKEAGISSHKLNKTLTETQENWHSCQNQLNALQENFTSLEVKERAQKEAIKNLQKQLSEKSKQLDDELKEERMRHQAEIQQLRKQKQQDSSNGGGSQDYAGPSITLLTIIIAGFLTM